MVIQYLLVAVFVTALAVTWRRVRQGALDRLAALAWSVLWVAAGVVVLRPETASALARVLGVGRGADVIVYLALVGAFALIFRLFAKIESLERQLTALVRGIALKDAGKETHGRE
jgi:hypothetical protein